MAVAAATTLAICLPTQAAQTFGFAEVVRQAAMLAQRDFDLTGEKLPEFIAKTTYDQWRDIRFKPEKALWKKENGLFRVELFHPGFVHNRIVKINVIEDGRAQPIPFSPDLFDYGKNEFGKRTPHLGFAGLRVRFPINHPGIEDEFLVFLGASYFRAVGKGQQYGLSARGLAVDTALPSGEEFPWFKEFWLQKPQRGARSLTLYALLESPSLTGAYRFVVTPGAETVMAVSGKLFKRREVSTVGIAPLTSMFFYGENMNRRPADDFRPEIHDSDGLLIEAAAGERLWRPLVNPDRLLVSSFDLENPVGFGLLQRDRDFDHYQDLEARYQLRPSLWVVPGTNWGKGRVELVQIPADEEYDDNIVAYWAPAYGFRNRKEIDFSYDLIWGRAGEDREPLAGVVATRTAFVPQKKSRRFLVDFEGKQLNSLPADTALTADLNVKGGEVIDHQIQKNPMTGGWRLVFNVKPGRPNAEKAAPDTRSAAGLLDMRADLRKGDRVLTEIWSYLIEAGVAYEEQEKVEEEENVEHRMSNDERRSRERAGNIER